MPCCTCFLCCTYNLVPIPQTKRINKYLTIRGKEIKVLPTPQPNRILTHKPTRIRVVVPEEVVMQPRLTVGILVLQAEGLISDIRYLCCLAQRGGDNST